MAQRYDITIEAGADSDVRFYVDGADVKGGDVRMQVRKDFMTDDIIDELTVSNGRIIIDDDGCVHLNFSSVKSNQIRGTDAFYDIFLSADGNTTRILQGRFKCVMQITR